MKSNSLKILLASSILLSTLAFPIPAQTCNNHAFAGNHAFKNCTDLPVLDAFLHWTYDAASGNLQMAYRQVTASSWVAWAINPTAASMLGAQALVALRESNGTVRAYTSPINSYTITTLTEGPLSFPVRDLTASYADGEMIIFATLQLPRNSTSVNQVWQDGPLSDGSPGRHDQNADHISSIASLDLVSGQTTPVAGGAGDGGAASRIKQRNIHGVVNTVSWGILMPSGAIIARYLKVFKSADPAWFYLHVACQFSAYVVGVSGWATGLKLGSDSKGIQYNPHRTIAIILFCLATLQAFALLVRPNKDHKYRLFWNIYHHSIGYAVIILSIVNIYQGFNILKPNNKWKQAYTGVIAALGIIAVSLEACTWFIVIKRKPRSAMGLNHHKTQTT